MRALAILFAVCCLCVAIPARAGVKAGTDAPRGPDPITVTGPPAAFLPAEVLIDFDDVSAQCVFAQTTALRDAHLPLGVRFIGPDALGGGAILNSCSNFSVTGFSGSNFLAFNAVAISLMDGGVPATPETLRFVSPVSAVSVLAGSSAGAGNAVRLEAYNSLNVFVDQNTRTLAAAMEPVGVTGPSISYVVITGPTQLVLDNLRFTPGAPVSTLHSSWARVKAVYR